MDSKSIAPRGVWVRFPPSASHGATVRQASRAVQARLGGLRVELGEPARDPRCRPRKLPCSLRVSDDRGAQLHAHALSELRSLLGTRRDLERNGDDLLAIRFAP